MIRKKKEGQPDEITVNDVNERKNLKILLAAEILIFVALSIFLILMHTGLPITKTRTSDADQSGYSASAEDAQDSFRSIYASLLPGDYSAEDGKEYHFDSDGSFRGYLDENNENVKGTYSVAADGNQNIVTISKDMISVEYNFDFTSDGELKLTDCNTKKEIILTDK